MEKIYDILKDINPDIDYKTRTDLIDAHLLDSLSIISLIAELEDVFDITVPAVDIIPENFNSVQAMYALVERLSEED
ncbi:MAG: phosphopantetheine-binding protein [Oscillospiraceae bacterium]|nr:phosphopantetheine-binding protein [Oscillospiraceae bacterium]